MAEAEAGCSPVKQSCDLLRTTSGGAMEGEHGRIKVGCCGFPMARTECFRQFPVVEIQQTFYNLPRVQTAKGWRAEALALNPLPGREAFEFTLKAWQLITHEPSSPTYRRLRKAIPDTEKHLYGSFRPTEPVRKAWTDTAAFAHVLGAKVVIFQCPARFTPTPEHLLAGLKAKLGPVLFQMPPSGRVNRHRLRLFLNYLTRLVLR